MEDHLDPSLAKSWNDQSKRFKGKKNKGGREYLVAMTTLLLTAIHSPRMQASITPEKGKGDN